MEELLRPKTRQELSDAYGICRKTLQRWLQKEDIKLQKGLIRRKDLELIYLTFGLPPKSKSRDSSF